MKLLSKSRTAQARKQPVRLNLETLERRLVPADISGMLADPSQGSGILAFTNDHGNVHFSTGFGNFALEIRQGPGIGNWVVSNPFDLNNRFEFAAPTGDLDIDLSAHSFVRLIGLNIAGNLHVHNADIMVVHCTIGGSADVTTDNMVDDWADMLNSHIHRGLPPPPPSPPSLLQHSTL